MTLDISFYWKLFMRRLPVMMLFVLLCSGLGVITAMKLPKVWATSARLLLEAPQIPDNMVTSTVQTDATEQLDIIQQKLLTRANLIDIANRFRVFSNISEMNPDVVFSEMRNAVQIKRSAGRNRATLMTISFEGRSGRVVANVVNELVTLVLAETSSFRITRAENTLDFFRHEAERLGTKLDEQSAKIAVFKSENADALPDDQRYRLDRLTLLQERLAQMEREKGAAKGQRNEIVRLYESTGQVRQGNENRNRSPQEEQLLVAKAELERARSIYSESHPQVLRLSNLVERLETLVSAQIDADNQLDETEEIEIRSAEDVLFQTALADIDTRTEFLTAEITRVQGEMQALQEANARSAANGIALSSLERDYANTQSRYNVTLNNLNAAQMGERIESTAQGQRITVIENANIPQEAAGPNRPLVAATGGLIGLALAAAYFMLLEVLNRVIRRPAELMHKFNIIPIIVVPYMETRAQRTMRHGMRMAAVLVVLIAVPLGLWYIDANYVPLDLIVQKGLARLGLG